MSLRLMMPHILAENNELHALVAAERERAQERASAVPAELESARNEGLLSKQQEIQSQLSALQGEIASLHTDHASLMARYEKELLVAQESARTAVVQADQQAAEARVSMEQLRQEKEKADRELRKTVTALSSANSMLAAIREEKEASQKREAALLATVGGLRSENEKMRREYAALHTRISDVIHSARQPEALSPQAGPAVGPGSSAASKSANKNSNPGINPESGRDKE